MNEQKKTAVGIRCEIPQEYQEQLGILRNMEGVQAVTVWEESTQRLEWNGYEAEITLTGTDQEYLQTHFPKAYSQGKHSSMAWAVVDESIIKQLKDAEKHGIQGYVPEDLLYQIVEINGEKVRVYGINIPEEKQEEHQVFVYADIEKYEEIAMSDTENRESVADTDILQGENHTDQEAYHYRIQVVNEAVAENYGKNMAVDSRAGRFSFEWGCTDMAAGKTLDGRTPRIYPIYATDKLRNMGKNLEKSESVLYCCRRNGRGNRLFTVVYEWLERVLIL